MNIATDTTVSYQVKNVSINRLVLAARKGILTITAPYEWLDAAGKVVRTGVNVYTEPQLVASFAAQGGDFAPIAAIMKALVTDAPTARCAINLAANGAMTANRIRVVRVDGEMSVEKTAFDAAQFSAAIAPLTVEQLGAMIQQFTAMIFAT